MTEAERLKNILLSADPIRERDLDDDWGDGELDEIADHLLANGVIVLTDDLIFILTAIAWGCSSNEALSPCATYYVNNEVLGNRKIKISEALYRFDKLLCEIANRRAGNAQNDLLEKYMQKMTNAIDNNNKEDGHASCDYYLCELLKELGYGEVVSIYDKQEKWYS